METSAKELLARVYNLDIENVFMSIILNVLDWVENPNMSSISHPNYAPNLVSCAQRHSLLHPCPMKTSEPKAQDPG